MRLALEQWFDFFCIRLVNAILLWSTISRAEMTIGKTWTDPRNSRSLGSSLLSLVLVKDGSSRHGVLLIARKLNFGEF